ncbi:MAG: biopolymer transporter ExbD [Bacteroidota bacterium]
MAIKTRNKISKDFSSSTMSDLVFLLLIFFMITSTLVSPNAIKLLLPNSNSQVRSPRTMSVYVKGQDEYYVEETRVGFAELQQQIQNKMMGQPDDGTVVLRADKDSPVQLIVNVIDAVNKINDASKKKYKVILATKPQD